MNNCLGVDISQWQDQNSTPQMYNPWKTRQMGGSFVGIKVSQSTWADPDYLMNWKNCENILHRLPYHFLVWDIKGARQAEAFWGLLEKNIFKGSLPLVVDFEWWQTIPSNAMTVLYDFLERMKVLSSPFPLGIYTAKSFWDTYGTNNSYWKQYDLWLCDISGTVEIPKPWDSWSFHQYTFKLNGLQWGAESLDLDGDYYNGTLSDMVKKYNLPLLEGLNPNPDPADPNIPEIKYEYWGTVAKNTTLSFRPQPNIIPDTLIKNDGYLRDGFTSKISGSSIDNKGRTWYKMGIEGWSCSGENGYKWINVEKKIVL